MTIALGAGLLACLFHFGFFLMESVFWGSAKINKIFGVSPEMAQSRELKSFAFNIFSDDEEGTPGLHGQLKCWKEFAHVADFFVVQKNVSVFENGFHALSIGHEVWRQVAKIGRAHV